MCVPVSRPSKLSLAGEPDSRVVATCLGLLLCCLFPAGLPYMQPYMREAWRVEPLHATHRGEHLDDLLLSLMLQGRALELDAAFDGPSSNRSPGLSPTSSTDGGEQLPAGDGVLEGVLGGHVFPLFPGSAASFAPVCTDVPTLQAGRQEGYRSARKLVTAIEALDRCTARSLQL